MIVLLKSVLNASALKLSFYEKVAKMEGKGRFYDVIVCIWEKMKIMKKNSQKHMNKEHIRYVMFILRNHIRPLSYIVGLTYPVLFLNCLKNN